MNFGNRSGGNAVIAVMMLAGVAAAVSVSTNNMLSRSVEKVASTRNQLDRRALGKLLEQGIDCATTLQYNQATRTVPNTVCPATGARAAIVLRNTAGAAIGTPGTGALQNSYNVTGGWHIMATCGPSGAAPGQRTLHVRAAKANNSSSGFATDPLTDAELSFNGNSAVVIGGDTASSSLCQAFLSDAGTCTIGTAIVNGLQAGSALVPRCSAIQEPMFASNSIRNHNLNDGTVNSAIIAAEAVNTLKLRDGNVSIEKVAQNSVNLNNIQNFAVTTGKIDSNQVNSQKIIDLSIISDRIQSRAIDSRVVADNSINSNLIARGAVGAAKLQNQTVDTFKVRDGSLTAPDVASLSIRNEDIRPGTLREDLFVDGSITGIEIGANQIVARHLAPLQIQSRHIQDRQISSEKIMDGHVSNGHVQARTLQNRKFARNGCADGSTFRYSTARGWECSESVEVEYNNCQLGQWGGQTVWDPSKYDYNYYAVGNGTHQPGSVYNKTDQGRPQACMHSIDVQTIAGGWSEDWVGCNENQGWYLAGCTFGDSNTVSSKFIHDLGERQRLHHANPAVNPPVSSTPWFFDRDANIVHRSYAGKQGRVCYTNDLAQFKNHVGRTGGWGLTATCIKLR